MVVEYLVRYADPEREQDVWVKATDLLCFRKVKEHFDGRVPADVQPRLPPEMPENIEIVSIERDGSGELMVCFRKTGDPEPHYLPQDEVAKQYKSQLLEFLEQSVEKSE
jgi:hypothetical protein